MENRDVAWTKCDLSAAARLPADDSLTNILSSSIGNGLTTLEADRRRALVGPNALRSHGASPWSVLVRQVRSPLLVLLLVAAAVSLTVGDRTDAVIVFVIVALSVGLGFFNEYRSEQAIEALHEAIRHLALVTRDAKQAKVDVVSLVPGDVVHLGVGDVVPADVRLVVSNDLECDEAVLTGESLPVSKNTAPVTESGASPACCALMGTVVRSGSATGIVVQTGTRTAFGTIAARLGERQPQTAFQIGLADFSKLLMKVAAALCTAIFLINLVLRNSLLEALLFALAIAIGITPQLLPAIVTVSLSTGARRLAKKRVVVKRLVTIEDLGNITVLFTDKTGTLTEGHISFIGGLDASGQSDDDLLSYGLLCNEAIVEDSNVIGGNALDTALWEAGLKLRRPIPASKRLATLAFDHDRQLASVAVQRDNEIQLITKGAPEAVLAKCESVPDGAQATLDRLFADGIRVVAVGTRNVAQAERLSTADERNLTLRGFLTFSDPPKADAMESLARLAELGIEVKVITGDNPTVAAHVCTELNLPPGQVVTGAQLSQMNDVELRDSLKTTRVFARVSPDQKSRVIRAQRATGSDVAFLGDGVNDAVAIHDADVGISVEGASEVATDAADIVLLDKDLGVLAGGVVEGRRIFANTIKYVLMATSSNFGNMFSAAGASAFLSFLPMLPGQILLNNLLYDLSQTSIPTDHVDEEQLRRPSGWDVGFIRRFMVTFGPISSVFDVITFVLMLRVLHAGPAEFRSGWFVESLATQTLVIFVIRTRRVPFWRSRPSVPLGAATVVCLAVAIAIPFSPLAPSLGFTSLPAEFLGILALMVIAYLTSCEIGKFFFYRHLPRPKQAVAKSPDLHERRVHRRASRFSMSIK